MKELLISIVEGLVEDKSAIKVDVEKNETTNVTIYRLNVAPDDMGRIIGKQGRIAKAIRILMRAKAVKLNEKIMVEID
ncbi:MAG: KH domain-containing protein [Oscillospiraceae bacterium]|nr:KH domain-containing protein [Oscillospiraceae bacterium]